MAKAKSHKLHLSLFTSFQICRPKRASSMIKSPLHGSHPPHTHMLSPLNSKVFDISFPGSPLPPPSTPSSKIVPLETDSFFSSPSSIDSSSHLKTINGEEILKKQPKHKALKPRRFKSKEWKEGESCDEKKPMLERLASCKADQSFVVVKKSVNPYEDFKRSMSEMIVEKQIFEPKELEKLLMSFLSLNSRMHHKVIIEAFTEILKQVFCG